MTFTIATYNIRNGVALDRESFWPRRRHALRRVLADVDADVWGLQEVYRFQLRWLQRHALGSHEACSVGRGGKGRGEAVPVLVRRQGFEVVSSHVRWFGDQPHVAGSRIPGAGFPRIATLVTVEHDGARFGVANVHLDEKSADRRAASAEQLVGWLDELMADLPVAVLGDFNALSDADELGPLHDAGLAPLLGEGHAGTSHGFHRYPPKQIDNIWLSAGWQRPRVEVIERAGTASDHVPVVVEVSLD